MNTAKNNIEGQIVLKNLIFNCFMKIALLPCYQMMMLEMTNDVDCEAMVKQ